MKDRKPNRIDNSDLRGAEQAMQRVTAAVKVREEAAALLAAVGKPGSSDSMIDRILTERE